MAEQISEELRQRQNNKREQYIKTAVLDAKQNFKSVAVALRYYNYILNNNPLNDFEISYYKEIMSRIKAISDSEFKGDYE